MSDFQSVATLEPVRDLRFDARPASVWSRDGDRILWANPVAAKFFGATNLDDLAMLRFPSGSGASQQMRRVIDGKSQGSFQLMRFSLGTRTQSLPCALEPIFLANGEDAVLVVGAMPDPRAPVTEAERQTAYDRLAGIVDEMVYDDDHALSDEAVDPASGILNAAVSDDGPTQVKDATDHREKSQSQTTGTDASSDKENGLISTGVGEPSVTDAEEKASVVDSRDLDDKPDQETAQPDDRAASGASDEITTSLHETVDVLQSVSQDNSGTQEVGKFSFAKKTQPDRFVWQMDTNECFSSVSPELADAVGPINGSIVGESWQSVVDRLDLGNADAVSHALQRRDTWSGLTVYWPVDGSNHAVPIDLAALPAFDRDRNFSGFRGFGICRTAEARALLQTVSEEETADASGSMLAASGAASVAADAFALSKAENADKELPERSTTNVTEQDISLAEIEPVNALVSENAESQQLLQEIEQLSDFTPDQPRAAFDPEHQTSPASNKDAASDEQQDLDHAHDQGDGSMLLERKRDQASGSELETADETQVFIKTDNHTLLQEIDDPDDFTPDQLRAAFDPQEDDRSSSDILTSDTLVTNNIDQEADFATHDDAWGKENAELDSVALGNVEDSEKEPLEAHDASSDDAHKNVPISTDERTAAEKSDTENSDHNAPSDDDHQTSDADVPVLVPFPKRKNRAEERDDAEDRASVSSEDNKTNDQEDHEAEKLSPSERNAFEKVATALEAEVAANGDEATDAESDTSHADDEITQKDGDSTTLSSLVNGAARSDATADASDLSGDNAVAHDDDDLDQKSEEVGDSNGIAEDSEAIDTEDGNSTQSEDAFDVDVDVDVDVDDLPSPYRLILDEDGEKSGPKTARALIEALPVPAAVMQDNLVLTANELFMLRVAGKTSLDHATKRQIIWAGEEAVLVTLGDEDGQPSNVQVSQVSNEKAVESARLAEMEAVLDTATDGILLIDSKGKILTVNRSAEALFGAERDDLVEKSLLDFLAVESHREAVDYLDAMLEHGVASLLNDGREVIGQTLSGGLVPLFMTLGRIGSEKILRFCVVLKDITQWKKAEEDLTNAKRQAELASHQKSEFLATISHEVRTPLNAIIGFSEVMIAEQFGPVGNGRYKEYLNDIHASGMHMMSLINDLLDLSKIEAGKLDLAFEAVTLNDILRECAALMQPQANQERVIIRTSLPESVPDVVADPRSVRQIILNLVSNAIKFNRAGGQVILSSNHEESGEVILRVRDTGIGMSDGELEKALEPFRQINSTVLASDGSGLGLPLTKALTEANRARFFVQSAPDQGTMIEISFPVQRVLAE